MKQYFLGIDVGKNELVMSILNKEGKIIVAGHKFENSFIGFKAFEGFINDFILDYKTKYGELIVGMESTGHYWFNLMDFSKRLGIESVLVKGNVVKIIKELSSVSAKNDTLDSKTIAKCLCEGRYFKSTVRERDYDAIYSLVKLRDEYSKSIARDKNRIHKQMDVYNQILIKSGPTNFSKTNLSIFFTFPTPKDIINISVEDALVEVKKIAPKASYNAIKFHKEMCEEYCKVINDEITETEIIRIKMCIKKIIADMEFKEELDKQIEIEASNILAGYNELKDIRGMNKSSLIYVLCVIGDISNYPSIRHLISYFGLNIVDKSSGKFSGKCTISKYGSKAGRKHLYLIIESLKLHNEVYRIAYSYYKSRRSKATYIAKSIKVRMMAKFLRTIYSVVKNNVYYEEEKLLEGYKFNICDMVEFKNVFEGLKIQGKNESRSKNISDYELANSIYNIYSVK